MPPESIGLCSSPPSARFNNQILSIVEVSVADGMKTPLNRFRLDGQVAIVTGGGNGIGRATAELLVEAGAAVALIDRDERAVENTKVALLAAGAQVGAYIVDVTDEAAIEASFASNPQRATLRSTSSTPIATSSNSTARPWIEVIRSPESFGRALPASSARVVSPDRASVHRNWAQVQGTGKQSTQNSAPRITQNNFQNHIA
jgi:NAD(P)-dependent dehydrogenase (short-subunit alcohol dehydrogenase family)